MNRMNSLATRAFVFSFVPVCLVLAVSFFALSAAMERHVRAGLRDSIEKSDCYFRKLIRSRPPGWRNLPPEWPIARG